MSRTRQLVTALHEQGMKAERCGRDVEAWAPARPGHSVMVRASRRAAFPWRRVWSWQSGRAG
ncbi:MAG TPA: hypothetical protein VKD26_05485, partial [Streptosporangiaceae bacterium]|nr:hypothetical protein [Streptosporangiaceae bacterium]